MYRTKNLKKEKKKDISPSIFGVERTFPSHAPPISLQACLLSNEGSQTYYGLMWV